MSTPTLTIAPYANSRLETIYRSLVDGIATDGGATVSPDTGLPVPAMSGYVVAYGEPTLVIDAITGTAADSVRSFIAYALVWKEVMDIPGYIGGWCDPATGLFHFDVAETIPNLADAIAAGRTRNQLAIFDNITGTDIVIAGVTSV